MGEKNKSGREDRFEREVNDYTRHLEEDEDRNQSYRDYYDSNDCFIATAVYGSRDAPQVQTLRQLREELKKNIFGNTFVKFYYSGFGRKTADMIKNKAGFLMPPIRRGLDYIVQHYTDSRQTFK